MKINKNHLNFFFPLLVFTLSLFFLAYAPLTPDGIELLSIAKAGGVAHAPGTPILAWINRLVLLVSPFDAALSLAFMSLIFHALTVYILLKTFDLMTLGNLAKVLSIILYISFEPVVAMSLQIEKYAFLNLILAGFIFQFIKTYQDFNLKNVNILATITGIGFSHHYICITLLIPCLWILYRNKSSIRNQFTLALFPISLTLLISISSYLTLILMAKNAVWPNWGAITNLSELFEYLFSFNHGFLKDELNPSNSFGLFSFVDFYYSRSLYLIPALFLCGISLSIKAKKYILLPIFIAFILQVFIIMQIQVQAVSEHFGYFERYISIFSISIILFIALSFNHIIKSNFKIVKILFICIGLISPLLSLHSSGDRFFAYQNKYQTIYQNISYQFSQDAYLFTQSDIINFHHYPNTHPIAYLIPYSWYRDRVLPKLITNWPSVRNELSKLDSFSYHDIIKIIYELGHPVATTNFELFKLIPKPYELRGFIFYAHKNQTQDEINDNHLIASKEVCKELLKEKVNLPINGHFFLRRVIQRYQFLFKNLSALFVRKNEPELAETIFQFSEKFKPGLSIKSIHQHCNLIINYQ